jgi:hypothetical protein
LNAETGVMNFSSFSFRKFAQHYYKCVEDFESPDDFSPVPYALLCRAIELQLKSLLLKAADAGGSGQANMKEYGHNLEKAYEALDASDKVLTGDDLKLLREANAIYNIGKGFDYITPTDAAHGYSRFPNLDALKALTKKLIE